jgi:hypothetical protein
MSRAAFTYPTKDQLKSMSVASLDQHIRSIRRRLVAFPSGPVHKSITKHLEVVEKVRELQAAKEAAGDV